MDSYPQWFAAMFENRQIKAFRLLYCEDIVTRWRHATSQSTVELLSVCLPITNSAWATAELFSGTHSANCNISYSASLYLKVASENPTNSSNAPVIAVTLIILTHQSLDSTK